SLIGKDPANVDGYNLLEPLNDFEKTVWQGNNGAIWALIAIDANNSTCSQRNAYVNAVVKAQLESGAWSISGDSADIDMTGMALQALSGYSDKNQATIDKGFSYIEQQFAAGNITSSESYAQCIVAYAANNRQLPDGMYEAFVQYRKADGSFEHVLGQGSNQMASEQGLYALAALYRAENGMGKLYKF
ncbi:MAG: hypothetical protein Q4E99_04905, partial [Bacillota bacterium]|nr:hypothetical protein [Bacillota bacterium]